ncbi:MAG: indolepyruvate oxidoreductase subunit beta [Clostridiales bacterium]|nr:indolepyruvate oxidoreductase subunit beta [Clostridiales bacterium]
MDNQINASIVLAGVGGQGTLIAGKLLGILAMNLGLDVKVSEVHGMSQRGGSVVTYVKIAPEVHSPIIEEGTADFILSFEEVESVRWAKLLKKGGTMIVNTQRIKSLPVLMGQMKYPEGIIESLKNASGDDAKIVPIDATGLSLETGTTKATNIVMLGALSNYFGVSDEQWQKAIEEAFATKPMTIPGNLSAFEKGRTAGQA